MYKGKYFFFRAKKGGLPIDKKWSYAQNNERYGNVFNTISIEKIKNYIARQVRKCRNKFNTR